MVDTRAIEQAVKHRPWPMPRVPWVLFQSWTDLLFAHWPVPAEALRPRVPESLQLDLYEGRAWVGITPFVLRDFRPRGLPALPSISSFPELNLRTYVRVGGQGGIYFFSLDAASRAAVSGARIAFRLPYHLAEMKAEEAGARVRFRSRREDGSARFVARYEPTDHAFEARPGSLEHFLTERYALFTVLRSGGVLKAEVQHRPWPLQPAEAEIEENELASAEGVRLPADPPLVHFARRQDALIWLPMRVDGPGHR